MDRLNRFVAQVYGYTVCLITVIVMLISIKGVIDAAYRDDDWTVIDWKTDLDDAAWAERREQYQAQVDEYAAMLARATGQPATGVLVRLVSA